MAVQKLYRKQYRESSVSEVCHANQRLFTSFTIHAATFWDSESADHCGRLWESCGDASSYIKGQLQLQRQYKALRAGRAAIC